MKKATTAIAAATVAMGISFLGAPMAAAETGLTTTTFGGSAGLHSGDLLQAWTVSHLQPSSDTIPYAVQGQLWEATAKDVAVNGSVQPIVSNFNARAKDGTTYRVLFGVATPQGVNPAPLAQGAETSGKIYFDVTGPPPDSVVYNAGGTDLLLWLPPPPATAGGGGTSSGYATATPGTAAQEAAPGTGVEGAEAAPGAAEAVPNPQSPTEVSEGTPLPSTGTEGATPGSEGTPEVASEGTPVTETPAGPAPTTAAAPSGTDGQPAPATPDSSQGTPVTPTAPAVPVVPAAPVGQPPVAVQ